MALGLFVALFLCSIMIPNSVNEVYASEIYEGVALKSPTNIYSSTSRNSSILKDYEKGSILLFLPHDEDWYRAVVFKKGERHIGYINRADVEKSTDKQVVLEGIGLKTHTAVYEKASLNSSKLKTYAEGTVIMYMSFTANWYKAVVFVDGDRKTGYIKKEHVENIVEKQQLLKGIGQKSPTAVYARASLDSNTLRTYPKGSILMYKTFTGQWYEAVVFVNGNRKTGYINVNHVDELFDSQEQIEGYAKASPTKIYSRAARSSDVLKKFSKETSLSYKSFSSKWYETTVNINGNDRTGYIHTSDVTQETPVEEPDDQDDVYDETKHESNYYEVVDQQMNRAPQVWYDGGFIDASEEQVAYYVNSSNFHKGDSSFLQFLDLSKPAELSANEINNRVLNGAGTLNGEARAFINAANKHNINEIYLMAHALHETGNGMSTLAQGIEVGKNKKDQSTVVTKKNRNNLSNIKVVYNMYGIQAFDNCAITCGAEHAYDMGWTTPAKAIVGGAAFIGNNYIKKGQNTLYKMRWNPDTPGHHQYATDVAWAVAQTSRISKIYNLIENYVMVFDIPKYEDQPNESGDPDHFIPPVDTTVVEYPNLITGVTTTDLNFRNLPTANNSKVYKTFAKGTRVRVLGTNKDNTWYYVKRGGQKGWVSIGGSQKFVKLLNMLEVTATNLNVRKSPNSDGEKTGQVSNEYIRAVIDKEGNYTTKDEWYQVWYNGQKSWVSDGKDGNFIREVK